MIRYAGSFRGALDVSPNFQKARDIWAWAERRIESSAGGSAVVQNYKDLASFARKARDAYSSGNAREGDDLMVKLRDRAQAYNIKLPR